MNLYNKCENHTCSEANSSYFWEEGGFKKKDKEIITILNLLFKHF